MGKVYKIIFLFLILLNLFTLGFMSYDNHKIKVEYQNALKESNEKSIQMKQLYEESQKKVSELETSINEYKEKKKKAPSITETTKQNNPQSNSSTEPIKQEKVAYLTFDDGPSENTPKILNILKKYNVKATFFVIGGNSSFYNSTIKSIHDEGHIVGNHTYSHDYASLYTSISAFKKDFQKNEDHLESILGYRPTVVRFPGGSNNTVSYKYGGKAIMDEIIKSMDWSSYQYFDWNVDSTDAEVNKQKTSTIVDTTLKEAKSKNNAIILFHDSAVKTTTVEALPQILDQLISLGYRFDTLNHDSYTVHFKKA